MVCTLKHAKLCDRSILQHFYLCKWLLYKSGVSILKSNPYSDPDLLIGEIPFP